MHFSAFQQEVMQVLGISEAEASPISLEMQRQIYETAFALYEKGDYLGAGKLFTQLVLANPYSEHYWQGIASSKQMAQEYLAAIHAWGMASLLKASDPLPHFHAAECLLSLDDGEEALKALDVALQLCQKDERLKEKIHLLKAIHYAKH